MEISFYSTPSHASMEYYKVNLNYSILIACVEVAGILFGSARKTAKCDY
jgi:hypothetical protein